MRTFRRTKRFGAGVNRLLKNFSTYLTATALLLMPLQTIPAIAKRPADFATPQLGAEVTTANSTDATAAEPVNKERALTNIAKMPLYFTENRGQLDRRVAYYVQGKTTNVYFTAQGLTFCLVKSDGLSTSSTANPAPWALNLDFVGANKNAKPIAEDQTSAVINYFKGAKKDWKTNLKTFRKIVYRDLWKGIDLEYSGTADAMKHSFVVKPGADPGQIKLAYHGIDKLQLTSSGQLEISTPAGSFTDDKPFSFQEVNGRQREVASAYELKRQTHDNTAIYNFAIGDYDHSKPLIIDPVMLIYSGYVGGSGDESGYDIAVDSSGNAYITGVTASAATTFPVGSGFDSTYNGGSLDGFVAKISAAGDALVYCSYIGGNEPGINNEYSQGIAVDGSGNAYLMGHTFASQAQGFPVTGGPDLTYNGGTDTFIAKLDASGTSLVYCGYIGGTSNDYGYSVAVDSSGNAYVTGITNSSDFPVSGGPDTSYNSNGDAFVAKVNATGTGLVYCGYIGGFQLDAGEAIAVDNAGNAYITGRTMSTESTFPKTVGPDLTFNGGSFDGDAFVAKVNAAGTLTYCGYIGGSSDDAAYSIAVDSSGNAYVTGYTNSSQATFPVTTGPDLTYNFGTDAFVAKVNSSGSGLVYCGYIGGSSEEKGNGIAVDSLGNAYITGYTASLQSSFPVLMGPDLTQNGNYDGFVTEVNSSGASLAYCGYIGGTLSDYGQEIAVDSSGNAYVVGYTGSSQAQGFPLAGGLDASFNGTNDVFVSKVSAVPSLAELTAFTAKRDANGAVLLEWQTGVEADNLGFNLYQEQQRQRTKITPDLIAGSALLAGHGAGVMTGHSYVWADKTSVSNQAQYWLEAIDLKGESKWYGPVAIEDANLALSNKPNSALLSNLSADPASATQNPFGGLQERRAAMPEMSAATVAAQASFAGQSAVKLTIKEEGWYRITQPELVAAGLDAKIDPRNLRLFVDGNEIPCSVNGEDNGRFDASDTVEFYGVGMGSSYTDERTYWLASGSEAGRRMKKAKTKNVSQVSDSFQSVVERRDRTIYFPSLRNGETENFFGKVVAKNPVDQLLRLPDPASASPNPGLLEVTVQGVTEALHYIKVTLNGTNLGATGFYGRENHTVKFELSASQLRASDNFVTLVGQAGDEDISLVDAIRLTYTRNYRADNDALRFTPQAKRRVAIGGFSSSAIRLLDVTDPDAAQTVAATVQAEGSTYSITAGAPKAAAPVWFAFTPSQIKKPVRINAYQPSGLQKTNQRADLLIVSPKDFFAALEPLKALRQSQGMNTLFVDIEDVYDEFSYGQKTPAALKAFLTFAKANWQKGPRYVLLAGDASLDPKNYLGFGDYDFVPTKLIDTQFMETASDEWFADVDNNGTADLAVGRLPVRTLEEAFNVVAKIIAYEQSAPSNDILLVADSNDGFDFEQASQQLKALIPQSLHVEEIHRGASGSANAKANLLRALGQGRKLVNYNGHGNIDQWKGDLLSNADTSGLIDGQRPSLFISMTCLNGYFQDAALESLSESLLKAEHGGAVAVWASTGMTNPTEQALMNRELFRHIFSDASLPLGEAIIKAKSVVRDSDVRRTWVLLGDPSMRIK